MQVGAERRESTEAACRRAHRLRSSVQGAFHRDESTLRRKPLETAGAPAYSHFQRITDASFHQEPIMTDNILSAVLTFGLLAAGTVAVGSEMWAGHHGAAAPTAHVTLAPVTVIGHRIPAVAAASTWPQVTITGHRNARTEVAAEDHAPLTQVQ
jgi:hypothetical protein